ncbi:MAG: cobaltochelatase subunit CobN [Bryobacterales bacterium]|nr:cobaltochelatase subunit CobN [Bryobacteraceae bacterium]MDW8356104.1 cobaltochelatase subunit CobN [Bryobacterales bacterium]
MIRTAATTVAMAVLLAAAPCRLKAGQHPKPVRAVVITSHASSLRQAMQQFQQRYGEGRLELILTSEKMECASLAGAGALFVEGGYWSDEMVACGGAVRAGAAGGLAVSGTMPSLVTAHWQVNPSPALAAAPAYRHGGGMENLVGFLVLLHNAAGGAPQIPLPQLEQRPSEGIYHPEAPAPFPSYSDYAAWLAGRGWDSRPRVGLLFPKQVLDHGDTAPLHALIRALENRALAPVPVFGWPLSRAERLLCPQGKPAIELILLLDAVMPSPENGLFLEKYGLHAMTLMSTSLSEEQWRSLEAGLPPGRLPIQIGNPERYGAAEPIVIAAASRAEDGRMVPLSAQIELAADRSARWIQLRRKPNSQKKLALVYFNNPPGKATLGASYLNLIPSLRNVLARLRQEGYQIGDELPGEEDLKKLLLLSGRNVGQYAPGELEELRSRGHTALLPVSRYKEWLAQLPPLLQQDVRRVWGRPEDSRLMTVRINGEPYFVMAGLRLGNVWLAPQPLRGDLEAADARTHDRRIPPPHSYLAAYLWIRNEIQADAVIHFGRHGTLEWLPGKDVSSPYFDAGIALIGDLPHIYYYLVDGGGEFLQAKRRSNAVIVSHLTPLLVSAGTPSGLADLEAAIRNYESTRESSPAVAREHAGAAWAAAQKAALDRQLKLSESLPLEVRMERLAAYLHELNEQAVPVGMHAIGDMPQEQALREALIAFLLQSATPATKAVINSQAADWAGSLLQGTLPGGISDPGLEQILRESADWLSRLRASPRAELDNLVALLSGAHVPSGVSGDPVRTPAALPSGRNLHDQDPRGFPSKAAWAAGERLARELISTYERKHGAPPKRVSFVLWYGESGRTQGLQEAQALALLGVRPVWNGRGQVADVELIPAHELGRPRVDVLFTMSGLYRDGMPEKIALLDKAIRLVREAQEDNVIQSQTLAVENDLIAGGVEPELARKAARARIFGPQPGVFGVGMAGMMEASRDAGEPAAAAQLYLRNMNYAYGAGLDGVRVQGALHSQLRRNEAVIHGRSSTLYGLIDNDETYQFAGGLNAATKFASGRAPEFLIANARRSGAERYEEASHFLHRELTTRLWNEKWIEGMKQAGYAGAQQIAKELEHLYGFRATAPEQVDSRVWQETLDVYIKDKRNLGLARWFQETNPHAREMVAARLIEIDRQGVHRFSAEDRRALISAYLSSVRNNGVSCYVNACANRALIRYAVAAAHQLGAASAQEIAAVEAAFRKAAPQPPAPQPAAPAARVGRRQTTLSLADRLRSVRVFDVPIEQFRVRPPQTAVEWLALLLPWPFGAFIGLLRRRLSQRATHVHLAIACSRSIKEILS